MGFLRFLLSLLFPLSDSAAVIESATPESFDRLLSPRQLSPRVVGLLPYRHTLVRSAVLEAKFHNNRKAISLLAGVLAQYLESVSEDERVLGSGVRVLVPVPLGLGRKRERGYNQIEEVCGALSEKIDTALIVRVRETRPQTSLSKRERVENVKDAFAVRGAVDPSAHYVVVDDVTTTGSTMHEVMNVLLRAGAQEVDGIALAY